MSQLSDDNSDHQIPWLPDERFALALDSHRGAVTQADEAGGDVLTVTTHRVIKHAVSGGRRVTGLLPLQQLTGIEVVDVTRSSERLTKGLIILGVGAVLAWLSWAVVGVPLLSLIVGGIPILVAVYMLAGYALPESEGELILHAAGFTLRQPLRSEDARRDAYLVGHRIYELIPNGVGTAPPVEPPFASPPAEQLPMPFDTPSESAPAGLGSMQPAIEPQMPLEAQQAASEVLAALGETWTPPSAPVDSPPSPYSAAAAGPAPGNWLAPDVVAAESPASAPEPSTASEAAPDIADDEVSASPPEPNAPTGESAKLAADSVSPDAVAEESGGPVSDEQAPADKDRADPS